MPKRIYVNNTELTKDKRFTYLTEDIVVGGSTIAVQSIVGFESLSTSSGQILCIGEIGNERSELRRTSITSGESPSNAYKWVYLRDTFQFDHPQDTKVYIVDWNRFDVQWSVSVTGTKSTIIAYPRYIEPDIKESSLVDSSQTSGYYFVRFNETVGDTNSDWSDAIPFGGYDDNTVYAIKKRALEYLNETVDGEVITHEFLNQALWDARREFHNSPGKRPFRRKFNTDIGNALTGSFRIELPTDVQRPFTAENIYGVRIGSEQNMTYHDKKEHDYAYRNIPHTTLQHAYTAGTSTSIWLANGRDFGESAVLQVEGQNISVTRIEGLTGESYYNSLRIHAHPSGAWNASVGSDVYENASFGLPDKFTVWQDPTASAYIYFNRPIDTAYVNQNIYADYYRSLVGYDSDADVLDEPEYDMYQYYLAARIKHRKRRGAGDITQDPDFKLWTVKRAQALQNEYLATDIRITPNVDHLPI